MVKPTVIPEPIIIKTKKGTVILDRTALEKAALSLIWNKGIKGSSATTREMNAFIAGYIEAYTDLHK